jgi:hypothetical protein
MSSTCSIVGIIEREHMAKFIVRFKAAHDATGLTPYAVSKKTGIAINTVVRYTEVDAVEVANLAPSVIRLAEFYGLDWRDPAVVEVIEDIGNPKRETPLLVPG